MSHSSEAHSSASGAAHTSAGSRNAEHDKHWKPGDPPDDSRDETLISVKFFAVLRKEVAVENGNLHLVKDSGEMYEMRHLRFDGVDHLFTLELPLSREDADGLSYTYCLTTSGKDYFETLTLETKNYKYRKLHKKASEQDKYVYQFDDVCLRWTTYQAIIYRKTVSTEIDDIRSQFIQTNLIHLMHCNDQVSEIQHLCQSLIDCVQLRRLHSTKMLEIEHSMESVVNEMKSALNQAIKCLKVNTPVQSVLAAAVLAEYLSIPLAKPSVTKLADIIKRNGDLKDSFQGLDDTVRGVLSTAVTYLLREACSALAAKEIMWIMALLYAVCPESDRVLYAQDDIPWEELSWGKAQRELSEMVEKHSEVIRRHTAFASSVLNMVSIENNDLQLLSDLRITPHQYLTQLLKWQQQCKFHTLEKAISTIVIKTKRWLQTSCQQDRIAETVKKDLHCCVLTTIKVIVESFKNNDDWTKHRVNVYSSLNLLSSFTGYLEILLDDQITDEDLASLNINEIMFHMFESIKRNWMHNKLQIQDWAELFLIQLPDMWQTYWERYLKILFTSKLKQECDENQLILYCENSGVCPAMDDCLLECAIEAINELYGPKDTLRRSPAFMVGNLVSAVNHQRIMSKCLKSEKLISCITEKKLSTRDMNHDDYILHLLFNNELKTLFSVLEEQKRLRRDYTAHLSKEAEELLAGAYTLTEELTKEMMNKSVPYKLMKDILKKKQRVNTLVLGRNKDKFLNALEKAEKDLDQFENRERNVRALYELNRGMPVDVQQLETTLSLDMEKQSMKTIMRMLTSEEEEQDSGKYFFKIQMFEKIDLLSKSTYFSKMWREQTNKVKNTEFTHATLIPLDQVESKIFKPTVEEFRKSYEELKDLSISLNDLETKLLYIQHNVKKELQTMAAVFCKNYESTWIENTHRHIQRFIELQFVQENAKTINDLKNHLGLGSVGDTDDLRLEDHKSLRDLTKDVCTSGKTENQIPPHVIPFLKEFDNCVTNGFIDWIKSIIKNTGELTVFIELASISAGENAMDIGKVCCFRDAVSACAPLIYELSENSGTDDLLKAIFKLTSALESDKKLIEKLRDSCNSREWLKIAYEKLGSVERSSLHQATDINESGIYTIKKPPQSKMTLENCISLKCKERSSDGNQVDRRYTLTELKDLQNKLMLITTTTKNQDDDNFTKYVQVLEQIINVGKIFLELCDAGHILFQDWEIKAYCDPSHKKRIWVKLPKTEVEIEGYSPLLDELEGLYSSLSACLSEWLNYMEKKRSMYYSLNHFTAKQLVYLCCSVADVQRVGMISTGLLNMLSILKENIEEIDIQNALTKALRTPVESDGSEAPLQLEKFLDDYPNTIEYFVESGFSEEEIKAAIIFLEESNEESAETDEIEKYRDCVLECIDKHQNDEEWIQKWCEKYESQKEDVLKTQIKFKVQKTDEDSFIKEKIAEAFERMNNSYEQIKMLWKTYHTKLSGLISDSFVDLDVLGEMMKHLAESAEVAVERKLPFSLEGGRPNLISCKDAEMLPLCLSLYSDAKQPLPTFDEILVCTTDTTAEEVELITRRALQHGSSHEKIYSLLNAEKLNHDVSRKFESFFHMLSKTLEGTSSHMYNLVLFCDSKADHSYVATAFDLHKKTIPENPNQHEDIKQYLKFKHQTSPEDETGFSKLQSSEQFQLRTKLIFSEHAGMGKSLYVKNLVRLSEEKLKTEGFTHKKIRINESQLRTEDIVSHLQLYNDKPEDKIPRIFHFDMPPVVSKGLYTFLLQLFVLRCFQSPDGFIWRCNDSHIYLVEYTKRKHKKYGCHNPEISSQIEETFLEIFPAVKCLSPEETQEHLQQGGPHDNEHQLMDHSEFGSEAFQRTYQYFKRYQNNQLEGFSFIPGSTEDSPKEWLDCLLKICDIKNPSWGELRNFTHFLSSQLKKCEQSVFCSEALQEDLTGFKKFVVKFMITMSKDFCMRSLQTSDESDEKEEDGNDLREFQLRRRWEQQAHPYILFNADHTCMTFLGFHIYNLHAIDVRTNETLEKNIMDWKLFAQLRAQRVPFNIDFEKLNRRSQLDILSKVFGVDIVEDPDDTYQLTLDNVMKMLAIFLRFESDIPVIIMGETGCGKTRLVQFMCDLMRSGTQRQNLIVVRVHGGTTPEIIYDKVRHAVEISKENKAHNLDTVLFFDEANTTEAVNAIKEVVCDRSVNGEQINAPRLKVIVACNPYRKHTKEAIEQLEKAGLGYRVRCEDTEDKLGQIPMRQLVYRVQPLPPSLTHLVWDFGKLNEYTQDLYITQMVKTFFLKENLPREHQPLFTKVISASQKHVAESADECRMVSLRDIERCLKTVMWFYHQKDTLFQEIDQNRGQKWNVDDLIRSLILAVYVCYSVSLEKRELYLESISEAFSPSCTLTEIHREIELCKETFIWNVQCPDSVAKNEALKENVFMMVVCMNLRIPLFLVGKPGSSKSLSKTIAAHAMQGKASQNDLFKGYKQAQLASFQCSPYSSPDGIVSIFRQCAQFQKDKNLDEYVSVVVLDEIGLAEDSPKMPLKTLHPLLEYGSTDDDNPDDFQKVGFIGISNWSLDPAKMNRGILVLRTSPLKVELESTALDICSSDKESINNEIQVLIPMLTEFYLGVLEEQPSEFFGLRDFYCLVKLIVSYATQKNERPSNEDLTKAVQRNFEGLDSVNILQIFWKLLKEETKKCDTLSLLRENLQMRTTGFTSRYLLLPTVNHAALQILKSQKIIDESNTEIIIGSGFPHDEEYSQVCRTVNKIKTCMETGRPVVLLNIQNLYESLYDALNQCYVKLGGSYYVDLGLGSHRVKCRVKDEFRLIVIEEKSTVYEQFPTPLLNRLEKHCLEMSSILPEHAQKILADLERWLESLVADISVESKEQLSIHKKKFDTIVGFTEDTCASVLLQCCPEILRNTEKLDRRSAEVLEKAKKMLLQCATPDSVLRASQYMGQNGNLLNEYFKQQEHTNLLELLKKNTGGNSFEVSTYSRLLNEKDVEKICEELKIDAKLFLLNEFYTEQSFSKTVRKFLIGGDGRRKLLLLQSYFDDPKQGQRLLFCVRHCIAQLRSSVKAYFDAVLLTRLPRISGGSGYIASFGDNWISLHLDELIPTPGVPGDIFELQRQNIAAILNTGKGNSETGCSNDQQNMLVDTQSLMRKSLQKGILHLRDKADNSGRATKRIEILYKLLHDENPESEKFRKALEKRITSLLDEQEKKKRDTGENWVIAQAFSERFVVEGGSFRHTLWVHLEDIVASALAQILAVIDGDNNLDNLINQPPVSSEKSDFWLNVFEGGDWNLLQISDTNFPGKVPVLSTGQKDKSRTCCFPFSWVLKERFDLIWSNVIEAKGPTIQPNVEYMEAFEKSINLPWIQSITKDKELFALFSEDLVNISMPAYPCELNKAFSDNLLELTARVYQDLTGEEPDSVSLPWLYVTNKYMHDNHQLFYSLFLQNKDLVTAGEATMALKQALEGLRPQEKVLKDFTSCREWLRRVKSLSLAVDLILSEDSLVGSLAENAPALIADIRLFWQSTWIIYLLMDHLLQNESEMEKKLLIVLVRNLIWTWKKLNTQEANQMEYVIAQVTGTLNTCSKNACNVFRVLCGYCNKEFTEQDTAELQCGHMFHISCLNDNDATQCRKCKKEISINYKQCGDVYRETFQKVNNFRRKCNSFFVEFMWNFVSKKDQLTDKVVGMLMDYVRCSLPEDTESEQSLLQHCLKPNPAVQSLVLKILLKCGMDETAPQLQRFIEEAVKSNEENSDEIYFMVVRSIEDHISYSNKGCLIKKAKECLDKYNETGTDDLCTVAKLRFAISVVSDTIHTALTEDFEGQVTPEGTKSLWKSLEQTISEKRNPWIQIFLFRNLYNIEGFRIIHHLMETKSFEWAIPHEVFNEQGTSTGQMDSFLVYGEMSEKIAVNAVKAQEEPLYEFAQDIDQSSACFAVCMALAEIKQATHSEPLRDNESSPIAKMKSSTDGIWKELGTMCETMLHGLEGLHCDLSQIIFHTALVAKISTAPEMELLKTLCFEPGNAKDFFLPTMPSSIHEVEGWVNTQYNEVTLWECTCGEPVLIADCGRPFYKGQCISCHRVVGGQSHRPVQGFTLFEATRNAERRGRGHSLRDPDSRNEQDGERNLYGAHLCLVRAIIHSSMIWATIENTEEIGDFVHAGHDNVRGHLNNHLQKDIELLAKALGKNTEDAVMAVHMFLRFMLESNYEQKDGIEKTDTEEKRGKWESAIHERLKLFFQDFAEELTRTQNNILRSRGMNILAQIIYSEEPQLADLPTTGVSSLPLMWRFGQRMTLQHLINLIEQEDAGENVPVLLEILKKHRHIEYIRFLPQVLSLQQTLMFKFENVDPQGYAVPIDTYSLECIPEDCKHAFNENVAIMKKIWKHLKRVNDNALPHDLKQKDEEDLMILDFLPMRKSVARVVTEYLVRMQNDIIDCVNPREDRSISAYDVKPSHVISCVPEQDFLNIAISNTDHVLNNDGKEHTKYNFQTVERQLVDRFFMEKPLIDLMTIPLFEYRTGTTLRAFFSTVKDKLEPLSTNDWNCIMNDFRFLNEISAALSTLKIAIGFMKLSFPNPNQYLTNYLKKDLKLDDRLHTLSRPVLRSSRVKHIQSLWEVLSLRQSSLLIEMNQNPFFMIDDQEFHVQFSEEEKKEKMKVLAGLSNINVLITELHYVIMNIRFKDISPDWGIMETFEAFDDKNEIDVKAVECLEPLRDLEMKYGIALWKLAVQMKKGIRGTR